MSSRLLPSENPYVATTLRFPFSSKNILELSIKTTKLYYDIDSFRPDMRSIIQTTNKNGINVIIEWEEEDLYLSLSELLEYAPSAIYTGCKYPEHSVIRIPKRLYVRRNKTDYVYHNIR